jgi:hypothetical protein
MIIIISHSFTYNTANKKLLSDTIIPAGERRVEACDIKTRDALNYPLTATVKLNFRIYPQ